MDDGLEPGRELVLESGRDDCRELARLVLEGALWLPSELILLRGDAPAINEQCSLSSEARELCLLSSSAIAAPSSPCSNDRVLPIAWRSDSACWVCLLLCLSFSRAARHCPSAPSSSSTSSPGRLCVCAEAGVVTASVNHSRAVCRSF